MSHKHHHHEPQKDKPAASEVKEQAKEHPAIHIPEDETSAKLRGELEQAKDRALRLQAELDNYRKRASRELEDRLKYANMGILRELLPVVDNIQRAIEHAGNSSDSASLLEGFKMVGGQLQSVLEKHDCKMIEALHAPFDPNLHQAISLMPSADYPPNTIILVSQEGYQLHDRVVRPSQVIVSTAPSQANAPTTEENGG
jgi:molecular chaperone GrpE